MAVERKYALRRVAAGDYLLVSNDGETLWRIYKYTEDGSAEYADGTKLTGEFWATAKCLAPYWKPEYAGLTDDDLGDWNIWETWDTTLATRRDAVDAALNVPTARAGVLR